MDKVSRAKEKILQTQNDALSILNSGVLATAKKDVAVNIASLRSAIEVLSEGMLDVLTILEE